MADILHKSKQVISEEGVAAFATKGLRKTLTPIMGREQAKLKYYYVNRVLKYGSLSPPNFECVKDIHDISGQGYQSFFGFYDKTPFGPKNNRILFNRVNAPVQQSSRNECPLEVCYYDINTDDIVEVGETKTWNWQQGCRLQWLPGSKNKIIYNKVINNNYGAVIQDVKRGEILKTFNQPIYDVGPNGKYALSIDFERLERGLPDYGYNNKKIGHNPTEEGIYRLDLNTTDSTLLMTFDQIEEQSTFTSKKEPYIMNIMFSPKGDKFMFLYRYNYARSYRPTNLICATTDGDIIKILGKDGNPSHPIWKSNSEILSTIKYSTDDQSTTKYVIYNCKNNKKLYLENSFLNFDSHPSFAPVGKDVLVLDSYPNHCGELNLYLLNMATGSYEILGSFYGPTKNNTKRDLHPRWDRKGKYICIDRPIPKNGRKCALISVESLL